MEVKYVSSEWWMRVRREEGKLQICEGIKEIGRKFMRNKKECIFFRTDWKSNKKENTNVKNIR